MARDVLAPLQIARAMAEPGVIIIRGCLIRVQQRNPGRGENQGERAELSATTME
jgi:hypothetical protein